MMTWCNLAENFPMKFDVDKLRKEYDQIKNENWLGHYDPTLSREWKAILLVSLDGKAVDEESQRGSFEMDRMKRTDIVRKLPYFEEILDNFKCPHGRIRILKLSPGAGINLHRDIRHEAANLALGKVRLHIPIYTNDDVTFFVDGEKIKMLPGNLYYVNFSKKHYVRNDGTEDRIHLVLDLDVNDWLMYFFPKLSMFEKIEHVVARTVLPIHWKLLYLYNKLGMAFWAWYKDSLVRKIRYKLFPKK
jgi:hypothetical protein